MSQPFLSGPMTVKPEWIDYNDHLNMAYYNVLFDHGVDALWDELGFGADYRDGEGATTYAAEFRVWYLRELQEGDEVRASFHLLDHTDKSWHFYQELIHADGWVAAAGEGVGLHIDTSGPRVAPMPPAIQAKFDALQAAHDQLPRPDRVGQPIGIRRKPGASAPRA